MWHVFTIQVSECWRPLRLDRGNYLHIMSRYDLRYYKTFLGTKRDYIITHHKRSV